MQLEIDANQVHDCRLDSVARQQPIVVANANEPERRLPPATTCPCVQVNDVDELADEDAAPPKFSPRQA